jgi:hypothetical protein
LVEPLEIRLHVLLKQKKCICGSEGVSITINKRINFSSIVICYKNLHCSLPLKFQGHFDEYWAWNMYLLTCGAMIKMRWCFSTSNRKILNLTMLIVCRKNLNQRDCTGYKFIPIEREDKVFFVGSPDCCQCFEVQ